MKINVYCDICYEFVATVDTDRLVYPLSGSMFKSPDPAHGMPDPFDPGAIWEFLWCPYSNKTHRITSDPGSFMTDGRARYRVPSYAEFESMRTKKAAEPKEVVEEEVNAVSESPEVIEQAIQEAAQPPVHDLPPDMDGDKPAMREAPKPDKTPAPVVGFPCRICGKVIKTELSLASHMARAHKPGSEGELE